jgi:hypothetical protein
VRGETIFSPWLKNDVQLTATLDLLLGIRILGGKPGSQARLDDWQSGMIAQAQSLPRSNFAGLQGAL